ncbi:hypothetical protein Tco_0773139 [Tanacetum coccineum]|uniref:Uncharacterized protein n=1 Tax=Tanacetum coccineum TaxID=301880 RepID=A0ABQ4ZNX1_9ASTR
MEAHCVNLELKYQNQALKQGQHGQFSKVKSNEAKVKHDIDVIETINIELEHKVAKLLKENETLKRHYKELFDSIKTTRAKTIEHTTSLIAKNDEFKAQLQEKGFVIAALKTRKPVLQPHRNHSVVRQPTAFKSERPRISKPQFASQVDVNNDLSKPVTTHYLPKERESAIVKPHHVITSSEYRNSSKNVSRFSSNDMVHNHYLEEAKKKTQESGRNSRPSVMPSARSQSTSNGSKPKPRINNQKSRNWHASKSSCVMTKTVPIAEHSRNSRNFSDSKHFVCFTCQKCVFNANHDTCVTKLPNEVNSRAKVPSNKTTNRNKPIEQTSFAKKLERQIPKRHSSELGIHDHNNEQSSSKLVPKVVPSADKIATSRQELELLFHHHITMLREECATIELTLEQSQQGVSNDVLAETGSIHNLLVFTKINSDIEVDIMDPVMQCTTFPSHSGGFYGGEGEDKELVVIGELDGDLLGEEEGE